MYAGQRMSPLSAFFLGIFGTGAVAVAGGSAIVLYAMNILSTNASSLVEFVDHGVANIPELIDALPPALAELLDDRRAPDYAAKLDIDVHFMPNKQTGDLHPVLTITNGGDEVVSLLSVRVAALDGRGNPVCEWTEVVATPIALDDDWRGPLMPRAKRYVVLSSDWRGLRIDDPAEVTAVVEISDVRVWLGTQSRIASASSGL